MSGRKITREFFANLIFFHTRHWSDSFSFNLESDCSKFEPVSSVRISENFVSQKQVKTVWKKQRSDEVRNKTDTRNGKSERSTQTWKKLDFFDSKNFWKNKTKSKGQNKSKSKLIRETNSLTGSSRQEKIRK